MPSGAEIKLKMGICDTRSSLSRAGNYTRDRRRVVCALRFFPRLRFDPRAVSVCAGAHGALTGFCLELLLDSDEKREKIFFFFFLNVNVSFSIQSKLHLRRGPTGQPESPKAVIVKCVSVQIPSYSHFLFK